MSKSFNKKETIVINLFAGPGAGKTTCAWEIAEKLKKLNYVTEYVSEYAKELVWDGRNDLLDGSVKNQTMIYNEQKHRIDRLVGKVDFVVTDSPILLSAAYLKETSMSFVQQIVSDFKSYHNFCIFIERGKTFEKEGRVHNEEQSKELDVTIKALLNENGIYYGTYNHSLIDLSIKNMQITFKKLNSSEKEYSSLKDQITEAQGLANKQPCNQRKNIER